MFLNGGGRGLRNIKFVDFVKIYMYTHIENKDDNMHKKDEFVQ